MSINVDAVVGLLIIILFTFNIVRYFFEKEDIKQIKYLLWSLMWVSLAMHRIIVETLLQ